MNTEEIQRKYREYGRRRKREKSRKMLSQQLKEHNCCNIMKPINNQIVQNLEGEDVMENNKVNKGLKIIALFIGLFIVNIIFVKLVEYIGFKIDNTSIYFISPAIATIILLLINKYLSKNK